jgi:hypothetical protein
VGGSPSSPLSPSLSASDAEAKAGAQRRRSIAGQQMLQRALSGGLLSESLDNSPRSSQDLGSLGSLFSPVGSFEVIPAVGAISIGHRRSLSNSSGGSGSGTIGSRSPDGLAVSAGKLLLSTRISSRGVPGVNTDIHPLRRNSLSGASGGGFGSLNTGRGGSSEAGFASVTAAPAPFLVRKRTAAPLLASLFGACGNLNDEPPTPKVLSVSPPGDGIRALALPLPATEAATAALLLSMTARGQEAMPVAAAGQSASVFTFDAALRASTGGAAAEDEPAAPLPLSPPPPRSPPSPAKTPRAGRLVPAPQSLPLLTLNGSDDDDEDNDIKDEAASANGAGPALPLRLSDASSAWFGAVSPTSAPATLRGIPFPGAPQRDDNDDAGDSSCRHRAVSDGLRTTAAASLFPRAASFNDQLLARGGSASTAAAATLDVRRGDVSGENSGGSVASWLEGRTVPGQGALDPASVVVLEVLRVSSRLRFSPPPL